MNVHIIKTAEVDRRGGKGNNSVWAIVRDTVNQVLVEAQNEPLDGDGFPRQPLGDLSIRFSYNASYLREEVHVTWDEVS